MTVTTGVNPTEAHSFKNSLENLNLCEFELTNLVFSAILTRCQSFALIDCLKKETDTLYSLLIVCAWAGEDQCVASIKPITISSMSVIHDFGLRHDE